MTGHKFLPLTTYREFPPGEMIRRAADFKEEMLRRRTVRQFSDRPVPRQIIEDCLTVAGSAPSGANQQPWKFVVVSDANVKRRIRDAAEKAEYDFYHGKAPQEWLNALAPLGTDEHKPYLEIAPYLIVIFVENFTLAADGKKLKNYYSTESAGIATGLLIAAIHHAGLVSLTHTPSPMGFLNQVLERPAHERAFLVLVVGYPATDACAPDIEKKPLDQIATFL
ncbi:MAG: nitroreductase family protein [Acidobacteriaceae bacterium]